MNSLGNRIRIIRGKTNQIHFSAEMGIPQTNLSRYERDVSVPDLGFLIRLADKFDVSLEWLVAGRGPMRPGDLTEQPTPSAHPVTPTAPEPAPSADCPHCARLEAKLEKLESKLESVEAQRDDLAMENRQLWKENGEYRERLARYEERAIKPDMEEPDPGDRPLA